MPSRRAPWLFTSSAASAARREHEHPADANQIVENARFRRAARRRIEHASTPARRRSRGWSAWRSFPASAPGACADGRRELGARANVCRHARRHDRDDSRTATLDVAGRRRHAAARAAEGSSRARVPEHDRSPAAAHAPGDAADHAQEVELRVPLPSRISPPPSRPTGSRPVPTKQTATYTKLSSETRTLLVSAHSVQRCSAKAAPRSARGGRVGRRAVGFVGFFSLHRRQVRHAPDAYSSAGRHEPASPSRRSSTA